MIKTIHRFTLITEIIVPSPSSNDLQQGHLQQVGTQSLRHSFTGYVP